MLACKRLVRLTVCLLLLGMLVAMVPGQPIVESAEAAQTGGRIVTLVRRSAYFSSTVIGCFENGTHLKVLGETQQFYRVDCYDMVGYIAKTQVQKDADGKYYVNCIIGSGETKTLESRNAEDAVALRSQVRTEALKYQGVPYVWGGTTPKGFDCSGFTSYVYKMVGNPISRSCYYQLGCGVIVPREELQCGDLIFFENTGEDGGFASHVGIYIGNGQLIHAGSKGITVVYLSNAYFDYHYMCARRVVLSDLGDLTAEPVIPAVGITQNINGSYWRESSQTTEESGNSFFATIIDNLGVIVLAHEMQNAERKVPNWDLSYCLQTTYS